MSRSRRHHVLSAAHPALPAMAIGLAGLLLWITAAPADDSARGDRASADLTELTLQDLMDLEVSSAAKQPEKLSDPPAAAFVITQEDIRRSGATTIADVLRMVPGVQVARRTANSWAISARGFNERYANKLLVQPTQAERDVYVEVTSRF